MIEKGAAEPLHTVLVADDDEAILLLIRRVLELAGYSVITADCGSQAVKLYEQYQPDMVLLDAVMPRLDGFKATEKLVETYRDNCAPIMIITSLNDDASVEKAFEVGAIDFISKPIQWSVMLKRMGRLLVAREIAKTLEREREQAVQERLDYERRLQQAQKNEAIGRVGSGIAHDFGNVLTSITGYVELAAQANADSGNARVQKYLSEIGHASGRAKKMVHDMQEASSQLGGSKKQIALHRVIADVVGALRTVSPDLILIQQSDVPKALFVDVAPVRLHEALMNLGANARDAIGEMGCIKIEVEQVSVDQQSCASCYEEYSGDYVVLSVIDDGVGVASDLLDKVFEPFFTTKGVGEGDGMGLAMVHGFVHQYGGHIEVISTVEKGSQFNIYLPLVSC